MRVGMQVDKAGRISIHGATTATEASFGHPVIMQLQASQHTNRCHPLILLAQSVHLLVVN